MIQDLRFGFRALSARPGFTVIAVLALGLGIGATTLIFSVVNSVLLRPLSFPNPERIVRIGENHQRDGLNIANVSYANYNDLVEQTQTLEQVAATRFWLANLSENGEPEQVTATMVSASFFPALGVTPMLGRAFTAAEDQPGNNKFVVISYGLWQKRYGGDQTLAGKTIKVNGENVTMLGVMPPGFEYPNQTKMWGTLVAKGSLRENRRSHLLQVIGRLKPGVTTAQAQAELSNIAQAIEQKHSGIDPNLTFNSDSLQSRLVAPIRPALLVFFAAVALLLLIACANVANLQLARATAREKEMAIRSALGAGHWRLARQLLTENTLLAGIGGSIGLLLAWWGVKLVASLDPANFPRINEVMIDWRVMAFTAFVSALTGVMFGLAPIFQLPKSALYEALKEGGRGSAGSTRNRLRQALVVTEIALALILLVGAGLLINSFVRLMQVNRGFDATNVLTVNINLPRAKYSEDARTIDFVRQTLERVKSIPGVRSAGVTSTLPFDGGPATSFEIVGRSAENSREPIADIRTVDADYFRTLAIPLRQGRNFSERDSAAAPRVMLVNEELARRYWPNENPVGQRITMKDWGDPLAGEIIGVVGDIKADGLDGEMRPMIYWPYPQFPNTFNNLVIRTDGNPLDVTAAVKAEVWAVDAEQPLARIQTLENLIADSVAPRRFNMLLLAGFAALALILAAIGIYGVISYTVSQRKHEIGVRMALGAGAGDVLKLILRQGMSLALLGTGIGGVVAFSLTRLMTTLLFGVSAYDPLTFSSIAALLLIVALLACWVPARRATKVDPLTALRHE